MERRRAMELSANLSTWLLYGAAAALVPLLFLFLERWFDGASLRPTALLSSGDLILVSLVLLLGAVGDFLLAQEGRNWSVFARIVVFAAWLVIAVGGLLYGRISSRSLEEVAHDLDANGHVATADELLAKYQSYHSGVMWQSLVAFGISLVLGIFMVRMKSLEGEVSP